MTGHYGVIVEEIGRGDADELPRPLRNASLGDDFFKPLSRFIMAAVLCFWPLVFAVRMTGPAGTGLLVACVLFGLFFFPAALLSALTGATYLNLRPDRIIGVIRACGAAYWVSVIAFAVSGVIYIGAIGVLDIALVSMISWQSRTETIISMAIAWTALLLGIYLFHFACWHLGLLYRAHHDEFPWVLQRHVYSRRTDTLAQLEAARKAAKHADLLRVNRPDREQRISEIRDAEKAKRAAQEAKPIWDRVAETRND
jgi:hypothetical protein